eukprot:scaffold1518_cov331-Pavlova_lutheri.AAC.5
MHPFSPLELASFSADAPSLSSCTLFPRVAGTCSTPFADALRHQGACLCALLRFQVASHATCRIQDLVVHLPKPSLSERSGQTRWWKVDHLGRKNEDEAQRFEKFESYCRRVVGARIGRGPVGRGRHRTTNFERFASERGTDRRIGRRTLGFASFYMTRYTNGWRLDRWGCRAA